MSACAWEVECVCALQARADGPPKQWRFTNDWYYEDQRGTVFTGVLTDIPEQGGRSAVYLGIVTQHDIQPSNGEGRFSKGELLWVRPEEIELVL